MEGAKLYRELFEASGTDPKVMGMYNFYGFMTAMVLVEGLERAGKRLTRDGLIKAMEGIKDFDGKGVFPGISYGPNDRAGTDAVVLVINEGGKQRIISDWIE